MSFSTADLIRNRDLPITTQPDALVRDALEKMIENDFSQLPVVDEANVLQGIVSHESILRGIFNYREPLDRLLVSHVSENAPEYNLDHTIFDLLKGLNDAAAVLIVDSGRQLIGIVTDWDTTSYFRRRAEDIMWVEDIEGVLKEHINAAFSSPVTGMVDETALQSAINDITDYSEQIAKKIHKGLKHYFKTKDFNEKLDEELVEAAFAELIDRNKKPKHFDQLTFYEYTEILLHKGCQIYRNRFGLSDMGLRTFLDEIRLSRNILAHFRSEITNRQRKQLRDCAELFDRYPPAYPQISKVAEFVEVSQEPLSSTTGISPMEEQTDVESSRYTRLALYLRNLSNKEDSIRLTFDEIEAIITGALPSSAYVHRAWWANDSVAHVQSQQWLEAGWRVTRINLTERAITFSRMREREDAYIRFFSSLRELVQKTDWFPLLNTSPNGANWISVASLPKLGSQLAIFAFSFNQGKQFRAELYIDTYDKDRNKRIFDELFLQRDEIETELGQKLKWERIDHKRASRIALYYERKVSIESNEEDLIALRTWSAKAIIRLYQVIADRADDVLKSALER